MNPLLGLASLDICLRWHECVSGSAYFSPVSLSGGLWLPQLKAQLLNTHSWVTATSPFHVGTPHFSSFSLSQETENLVMSPVLKWWGSIILSLTCQLIVIISSEQGREVLGWWDTSSPMRMMGCARAPICAGWTSICQPHKLVLGAAGVSQATCGCCAKYIHM